LFCISHRIIIKKGGGMGREGGREKKPFDSVFECEPFEVEKEEGKGEKKGRTTSEWSEIFGSTKREKGRGTIEKKKRKGGGAIFAWILPR